MKSRKILACLLALAATALPAAAQQSESSHPVFSLGFGAQYWHAKDMKDLLDENGMWGANLIARIRPSTYFAIDLRAGGEGVWDGKTYRVDGQKYEQDVTFTCCPFEAGLLLMLPVADAVTFYGGGGVGYYWYDIDVEVSSKHHHHYHREWHDSVDLDDDIGWYAVGGVNLSLARCLSLFGEVRYTDTETNPEDAKSFKIDCSGIGGQIGILFDF